MLFSSLSLRSSPAPPSGDRRCEDGSTRELRCKRDAERRPSGRAEPVGPPIFLLTWPTRDGSMGEFDGPDDDAGGSVMAVLPRGREHRTPDYPIEPLFLDRWSPRAMSGEPIDERELMRLFEAARWAPSTYNEQEWRFLYARRDSPHWPAFFGLLMEANQTWCGRAAVLMVVLSHKVFTQRRPAQPGAHLRRRGGLREPGAPGGRDGPGRPRHGGLRPGQGAGDAPGARRLRGRGDGRRRPSRATRPSCRPSSGRARSPPAASPSPRSPARGRSRSDRPASPGIVDKSKRMPS